MSWSPPDPWATPQASAPEPLVVGRRSVRSDALAGLLVAIGSVLLGAPFGLLWARLVPTTEVVVDAAGRAGYADPYTKDFIAADGFFLLGGAAVGLLVGLLAWRLGRRWAPGVVIGLGIGGLLAGYVAGRTGTLLGREEFRAALEAGRPAVVQPNVVLLAKTSIVGWPVAAIVGFVAPMLRRD